MLALKFLLDILWTTDDEYIYMLYIHKNEKNNWLLNTEWITVTDGVNKGGKILEDKKMHSEKSWVHFYYYFIFF